MSTSLQAAHAYLKEEPEAEHRALLKALIARVEAGDDDAGVELDDRFAGTLAFGTAGLRGAIGPGTNRMNRVVVSRASWGLGATLLCLGAAAKLGGAGLGSTNVGKSGLGKRGLGKRGPDKSSPAGVVVGFDGRHYSRRFAEDTAAVLAGLGIPVWLFDGVVPTPLCAFAVRHLGAAAGVMVTASHNPPEDNGYKVYQATGGQIIAPQDTTIAACIAEAPLLSAMARPTPFQAAAAGLRKVVPTSVTDAWHQAMRDVSLHPDVAAAAPLAIVYTAMHGVGHRDVVRALRTAGFDGLAVVPEQTEPDGAFPTVAFPNPEEPGAMDRALALATTVGADLVMANDPDADRLAVAIPTDDGYRMLSGNEVGWLLGADALRYDPEFIDADAPAKKLVVTTIVSSTMLSRMAAAHGAAYREVLTGFKWLADAGEKARAAGTARFVFGYEEALGYECGGLVRDKDGVHAAVRFAEMVAFLRTQGRSVQDELDRLALAYGLSVGAQWSVRLPGQDGLEQIDALMAKLRKAPIASLAGVDVTLRRDLRDDSVVVSRDVEANGDTAPLGLPTSNVLVYYDAEGTRLIVRPSGTEPKIKFYLEGVGRPADRAQIPAVRAERTARLDAIKADVMHHLGLT